MQQMILDTVQLNKNVGSNGLAAAKHKSTYKQNKSAVQSAE